MTNTFESEERDLISGCLKKVSNHFMLALGVAKRSKALKEGMKPYVEVEENQEIKHVLVSLREVKAGKIEIFLEDDKDDSQTEQEVLSEMDSVLNESLEEDTDTDTDKPKPDKSKPKSKSLAA